MPLEMRPGITIRRPRREVAAVMFDHRYDESWFDTVRAIDPEATPDATGPHERGIRFLLREIPVTLTLTDQAPERFIEYRTEDPFPLIVRLELESIPEGTLVRIRMRAETRGVLRLFKPLVRRRLRRSLLGDLEALKAIVENSPHRGMAAARPAEPTAARPCRTHSRHARPTHPPGSAGGGGRAASASLASAQGSHAELVAIPPAPRGGSPHVGRSGVPGSGR